MNKLLSTLEVAKILRISRVAVFKKIKSGEIKAEKVGRNYVVSKDEVLKALGLTIGEKSKTKIDDIVKRGVKEYGDVFKKLGKE
ncbi:MAG: helix-turn-helix domain-containing protein [Candidatus Yanofskybacteria bacterium]|nr:helix-turn-helix domain-containing protein [Candidatus Yanofskybacteria bacterium]